MHRKLHRREFVVATALLGCGSKSLGCVSNRRESAARTSPSTAWKPPRPASPPQPKSAEPLTQIDYPLFERFPALRAAVPRTPLASLPTPVAHARDLGNHLALPSLYLKRDGLSSEAYGGGKTRKLELLLGEACHRGATRVVTSGAVGSNHAVATAIFAQQLGLRTTLLLMPQAPSAHVRQNLLADFHHGATMRLVGSQRAVQAETRRILAKGSPDGPPYVIPAGGTSPLGNLAYVNAALELERQVRAGELPEPARIYVALGTMGCAAGLAVGLGLTELESELVMVRVSNVPTSTEARFDDLLDATVGWLRERDGSVPRLTRPDLRVTLRGGYLGRGYAQPTTKGRRALAAARDHGELELDLTYTAKTFAALVDDAAELGEQPVLFWNTHSRIAPDPGDVSHHQLPREFRSYFFGA